MAKTIRSDALVGIKLSQLMDLSYLIGMTKPRGLLPGSSIVIWNRLEEAIAEAIERGEVTSVDG